MPQRAVITCGEKNSYSGMGNNCIRLFALFNTNRCRSGEHAAAIRFLIYTNGGRKCRVRCFHAINLLKSNGNCNSKAAGDNRTRWQLIQVLILNHLV